MIARADNFDRCLAVVLEREGGFVNDPRDRGGATNMGITQTTLAAWRGLAVGVHDVEQLTRREAADIYRARYWLPMRCANLPAGVDLMVFDFGVNAGPNTSVRLLQRAVGIVDDGAIGPHTMAAVWGAKGLIDALVKTRLGYYRSLDNWSMFGTGWSYRTRQVAELARAMEGLPKAA